MKRALVTGGAGFIGLHLARRLLARGYVVDLVDDFSRAVRDAELDALAREPGVRMIEADLLDPAAVRRLPKEARVVFHLAAILGVARVLQEPGRVLRSNVAMLANVLDLAEAQPAIDRLVFASTSEVYAASVEQGRAPLPTPESALILLPDPAHPRSAYPLSKLYGEALCRHSGLPATIVRPHNVYGPRMGLSHVVPELMKKAHDQPAGGRLEVHSVDHRRSFCYVDDAVEMILRLAEAPGARGEAFNVGIEAPEIPIGELAARILAAMGRVLPLAPLPTTPGSPARRCPDMAKTLAVTGPVPATPLDEGLARTWAWYRRNVFEGGGASAR